MNRSHSAPAPSRWAIGERGTGLRERVGGVAARGEGFGREPVRRDEQERGVALREQLVRTTGRVDRPAGVPGRGRDASPRESPRRPPRPASRSVPPGVELTGGGRRRVEVVAARAPPRPAAPARARAGSRPPRDGRASVARARPRRRHPPAAGGPRPAAATPTGDPRTARAAPMPRRAGPARPGGGRAGRCVDAVAHAARTLGPRTAIIAASASSHARVAQHRAVRGAAVGVEDRGRPSSGRRTISSMSRSTPRPGRASPAARGQHRQNERPIAGRSRRPRRRRSTPAPRRGGQPLDRPALRHEGETALGERPHHQSDHRTPRRSRAPGPPLPRARRRRAGRSDHRDLVVALLDAWPASSRNRSGSARQPLPAAGLPRTVAWRSTSSIARRAAERVSLRPRRGERRLPRDTRVVEPVVGVRETAPGDELHDRRVPGHRTIVRVIAGPLLGVGPCRRLCYCRLLVPAPRHVADRRTAGGDVGEERGHPASWRQSRFC